VLLTELMLHVFVWVEENWSRFKCIVYFHVSLSNLINEIKLGCSTLLAEVLGRLKELSGEHNGGSRKAVRPLNEYGSTPQVQILGEMIQGELVSTAAVEALHGKWKL